MKYEFLSTAVVSVGKTTAIDHSTIPASLSAYTLEAKSYKVNAPVQLRAIQNGKPLVKKKVSVFSPEGWSNEMILSPICTPTIWCVKQAQVIFI